LQQVNPSAARSLEEGLEETLTLHRLGVPAELRTTLRTTNPIESAFSRVRTVCRNVKRWQPGDQRERWVGSGLIFAPRLSPQNRPYIITSKPANEVSLRTEALFVPWPLRSGNQLRQQQPNGGGR
jgi:hypothetical protein